MIIIFDFEVFKYDTLLGAMLVDDNSQTIEQVWGLDNIKQFYNKHLNDLWVGHNNDGYDNHILEAIIHDRTDIYNVSKHLINSEFRGKANLPIITYDLMCCRFYSLKMTELLTGKAIHTTDVDFNLDRPLTKEEIELTNEYNKDDLRQTYSNFLELKGQMSLRFDLLKEFHIDKKYLTATEAKLASLALHAKQIPGIEYQYVKPKLYDTLQVKNQEVLDFYRNEDFRKGKKLTVVLCGVEHQLGSGGIHAARKKYHNMSDDILYLDVSGYYNLVMILYNLLPRTIPVDGKELYKYMYKEQLRMKGITELIKVRRVYKTILLAVFGASMNKYTDFYDPQIGSLITITGQIFAVDLLEKLEGKIELIQSNTDGIMVRPLSGHTKEEIIDITKEWCKRTGFVIKPKIIHNLHQRDVNCYCYQDDGFYERKGDIFRSSWGEDLPVLNQLYDLKDSLIIGKMCINYFESHKLPEETLQEYKDKLVYFQYICKKQSYDYCTYETTNLVTGETTYKEVGGLNRCFAKKYDNTIGMVYKHKQRNGKDVKAKIANIPDNVFICNDNILDEKTIKDISKDIDYDWYVNRAYNRLLEFFPKIIDIL